MTHHANPAWLGRSPPGGVFANDRRRFGRRGGRPHGSRNRAILNEEFIAALLRHFRREGERAITRMAATQPSAYVKILTLLVPRELKLEHRNAVADLSDEQLEAMIADLEERIAAKAAAAKVIEGQAVEHPALPAPPKRKDRTNAVYDY